MRCLFALLIAISLFLSACGGGSQQKKAGPASVELSAEKAAVFLIAGEDKVKIAQAPGCQPLQPAEFERYGIPKAAKHALACQEAASGSYYYLLAEEEGHMVYEGLLAGSADSSDLVYHPLVRYSSGELKFDLGPRVDELVGTYTSSREEGSDILFVGLHEDTLIAEHFVTDGMLPPVNQLNLLMTGMAPIDSARLQLQRNSMRFQSEMGDGRFLRSRDGIEAWIQLKDSGRVRLQKVLSKDYSIPVN
jgi:hypothetical protein